MVICFALVIILGKLFGLTGGCVALVLMVGSYFLCTLLSMKFGKNGHHLLLIQIRKPKILKFSRPKYVKGKIL